MGFADQYFQKQKDFKLHIKAVPHKDLRFVVVIPCYYENNLIHSLSSLYDCYKPQSTVEIIVVINSSLNDSSKIKQHNLKTLKQAGEWIKGHQDSKFQYHLIYVPDLPPKFAGAGLARKIGMDEAVSRFDTVQNKSGIIISFDADSICDNNYFIEIEKSFNKYPDADGCSIYFEHPLSGNDFAEPVYRAICLYELHLRYYVQSLRVISFPYAYHTVGSCFAVKALAYVRQGGMNKRKAGEDFYFLHKIIPLGRFIDINTTCVIPSPRPSGRVPFGTGSAVSRFLTKEGSSLMTYNPSSFEALKRLLEVYPHFFKTTAAGSEKIIRQLPMPVKDFLHQIRAAGKIDEINRNCNNTGSFSRRFLAWFNAFTVLRFLNHCSRKYYQDVNIIDAANALLRKLRLTSNEIANSRELLDLLRKYERDTGVVIPRI
jgi:hypothetical protein